jgi:hypothetical protein
MTKQLTRERERFQLERKTKLVKAYGLIKGLLSGIECYKEEIGHEGLKKVLNEVRNILEELTGNQ